MRPYYPLGFFPTPLEKLHNLSKLFDEYQLYIKRDDNSGLALGGNKTRKLEYLVREALDLDCDTLITAGAQQSNHCRQTAAAAARAGLTCHLMLGGKEPAEYNGNLLLSRMLGANIHFTGDRRKGEDLAHLMQELKDKGKKPYVIPYGGSNVTGALGYARAVEELTEQLRENNLQMDYIFFASSSGGTQSGLIIGKELYKLKAEIIGINIDKVPNSDISLENEILRMLENCNTVTGITRAFKREEILLNREYDKPGYGVITAGEKRAMKLLAEKEGILLDPVYTARAFYGMLDQLERKLLKPGANVLFWHTGGVPACFSYGGEIIK